MTQLSRPFQIVLAATVLFALVWFVALRPHSTSSSSAPVASTPASTPAAAAAPSKIYHGAAPGVEGLTRDINRAHGAVAASQRAANKTASSAAEAPSQSTHVSSSSTTVTHTKQAGTSGRTTTHTTKSSGAIDSKHAVPAGTVTKSSVTVTKSKHGAPSSSVTVTKTAVHAAPVQQVAVEKQLKQGKVVLLLFWNPKGSDDVAVRKELQVVEKKQGGKIAVHYAFANQVGAFGSITKAIQVYQTPTILMVNGSGLTTTLTGFTDAFAIDQTIDEARHA